MASSSSWKLRALMKKNLLIMKRNCCSTIFEILFPIALILLCYVIRQAFQLKKYYFKDEEKDIPTYIKNTSSIYSQSYISPLLQGMYSYLELSIIPALKICSPMNDKFQARPIIASIGLPESIKQKIIDQAGDYKDFIKFVEYESIEKMEEIIKDKTYGKGGNEEICFGIRFKQDGHKYDYSLHYFESMFSQGVQDIPNMRNGIFDKFSTGPDLASYRKYQKSGYIYILKLINEYILNEETRNSGEDEEHRSTPKAQIDMAMIALPYENYRSDPFSAVIGYFIPFFMVIAYMCPLCLYVYRMVGEKENKSKEGMKIMGLNEGTYFLSYFIQYVIITFIDSVINTFFMSLLFSRIPFILLFVILFLWALDIFGLIFFFQSFIDKTRVALILSLLIYFVMFFISMACMDEDANKVLKIILSIFPPVSLELGIVLIGKFESHFKDFHIEDYFETYTNYSIFIMNLMQVIDFLLYLFLGYYLQNVIPHDFGIKRPLYFICTSEYWCSNKNKNNRKSEINLALNNLEVDLGSEELKIKKDMSDDAVNKEKNGRNQKKTNDYEQSNNKKLNEENINNDAPITILYPEYNSKNFENEDLYKDKTKPDDCLIVSNIVKAFEDGKVAVDHVNIKFYKDEIFALLGHNGAGKTTLISMLTGLYEATEGSAFYDGDDILDSNNMDEFRTKLGICPQHDVLFGQLTIREHLEMFCIFKGYSSGNIDEEINKTLHDFELDNIQNITAENLSAGQRRKLSIAIALVGGSKIIFLDEPSSGMDITSRRNLWDILKRQTEQKIIILTTHYMEEASVLGKRIGIINAGKMKCIGTPLFLIERFGKFMNLNITKEEGADNDKIIDFIQKRAQNIEYEILSEEILFRIPKKSEKSKNNDNLALSENSSHKNTQSNDSLDLTKFFEDLDNNLKNLGIKTYSASMPTLEDVFLNVAAEDAKLENQKLREKLAASEVQNDKILFETDFRENYQEKSKFWNDLKACFWRRFILTTRDIKGFLMEILCPILLVLVGLIVSQIDIIGASDPLVLDLASIGNQKILLGKADSTMNLDRYNFVDSTNISYQYIYDGSSSGTPREKIQDFVQEYYNIAKDKEDSVDHKVDMTSEDYVAYFGSLLMLKDSDADNENHYQFVEVLNTRVAHSVPLFTLHFLTKLIKANTKYPDEFQVNFINYPMPLTAELEESKDQTSNSLVIFFVAIAFSLIPANFVTIIVKEKLNNSKHLMRVSGISITAYWIINFLFELVKYYFTCGICLFLLWRFDFYKEYLYIFYLIYGPAMVSSTYILSFLFSTESGAQNGIILLNFLIGALGSTVILSLRALDNVKNIAKIIQYIISLLPSFCFNFGYSMILNKYMILMIEYEDDWFLLPESIILEKFNLLLAPILYLAIEFVVYTLCLALIESLSYFSCGVADFRLGTSVNDSKVLKEIDLANQEPTQIGVLNEDGTSNKKEYSVRIKNLNKSYFNGMCSARTEAIRNMSFCVEPGECFGLLGLNGAGKTTTFKCITQELSPNHGKIYINGRDMRNKFSELSAIFGYCPQFDAIFEYMSVYENLEFYGKIKGIKAEYLKQVVMAMIEEMSLGEFTNKIAGRLSGGNKRKLSVAISFLCSPSIVLLDEPSTGMDPEARRFMWSVIHKISTKGKKASVIMTTHSMDEAETLCKRMAIMVNGEFVCLGKANEIKEKYGYGYEIEVRIKPLSELKFEKILKESNLNKNLKINFQNINQILQEINKPNFINELTKGRFGSKIIREIQINNDIPIRTLLSWVFFVENALKFIKKAENYFENIILTEFIDNNFLFKMKKNQDTKSIGFFFGLFESNKSECFVTEYSIRQTSLEQIFNMFEDKQRKGNNKINEEMKEEIIIDKNVYNALLK